MPWKSPIDITEDQSRWSLKMRDSVDGKIIWEVERTIGVHVDKQELLNALRYSKDQFDKGYKEGRKVALDDAVTYCRNCKYNKNSKYSANIICTEGMPMSQWYDYCSKGKPRDEDSIDSASSD